MSFVVGGILFLGFIVLIKLFRLMEKSSEVIRITSLAFNILRDPNLDDHQKEVAIRMYAKKLFVLFFIITTGSATALFVPFVFIWLMEQIGLVSVDGIIASTLSHEFLISSALITIVIVWLMWRR